MSEGEVPLTRETFVQDVEYIGATKAQRMLVIKDDGEQVYVDVPEDVRMTGIIPDGYAVDFLLDPAVVIAGLRKNGMMYESQLPDEMVEKMRNIIMGPENMCLIPIGIWEGKMELVLSGLEKSANDEDADEDEEDSEDSEDSEEEGEEKRISAK